MRCRQPAGKITVVANGAGDVISIKIAKEIVDPEDVEFLEEAVLSGVTQAIEQGKAIASSEMSKITGGMGVPGLGLRRTDFQSVRPAEFHSAALLIRSSNTTTSSGQNVHGAHRPEARVPSYNR